MPNQIPRILKFVSRYGQCPKLSIPYKTKVKCDECDGVKPAGENEKEVCSKCKGTGMIENIERIIITQTQPYLLHDIPANKAKIQFLSTQRMVGVFNQITQNELIEYYTNPKNLPEIEKVMGKNDEKVLINKYKPEDEEEIILNLKKRGYKFIAPQDGTSMLYGIKEAIKMLEENGYTVTQTEVKPLVTEKIMDGALPAEVKEPIKDKEPETGPDRTMEELEKMPIFALRSYLASKGCKVDRSMNKTALLDVAKELNLPEKNGTKEEIKKALDDADKVFDAYPHKDNNNS